MSDLPDNYAESMGLTGANDDASLAFVVRLGWSPPSATASLWVAVFSGDRTWVYCQDDLPGPSSSSPEQANATYLVGGEADLAEVSRGALDSRFAGQIRIAVLAHAEAEPDAGPGESAVRIEATFRAESKPQKVVTGRFETPGRVEATIEVAGELQRLSGFGKWHEQRGPRARFAAAFTYMSVGGPGGAILASRNARGAWGYLASNGSVTPVSAFEVGSDSKRRDFNVTLADGRSFGGSAERRHRYSVAVEGNRRPGNIVVCSTPFGLMVGELNDWNPENRA